MFPAFLSFAPSLFVSQFSLHSETVASYSREHSIRRFGHLQRRVLTDIYEDNPEKPDDAGVHTMFWEPRSRKMRSRRRGNITYALVTVNLETTGLLKSVRFPFRSARISNFPSTRLPASLAAFAASPSSSKQNFIRPVVAILQRGSGKQEYGCSIRAATRKEEKKNGERERE